MVLVCSATVSPLEPEWSLAPHHMTDLLVLVFLVLVVCATHQSGISEASTHETHRVIWPTPEGVPIDKPQGQYVPKSHMAL